MYPQHLPKGWGGCFSNHGLVKVSAFGLLRNDKGIEGVPDLIIEIISPSNSFIDRYVKKASYAKFGVKEYWVADPANNTL